MYRILASFFVVFFGCSAATAGVVDFEDAWNDLGYASQVNSYYSSEGLVISGNYFGLIGGVSRGDQGNFDSEGTNGPASLSVNQLGQSIVLAFDETVDLSFDLSATFGLTSIVGFSASNGGNIVSAFQQSFTDILSNGLGTWYEQSFTGIDRLELSADQGWRAWQIDNLVFESSVSRDIPVPGPLTILGLGVLGLGMARRKKTA